MPLNVALEYVYFKFLPKIFQNPNKKILKGTFVVVPEGSNLKIKASTQHINQAYEYPKSPGFPFQQSFHLASTKEETTSKYAISDGRPDLRLQPVHQFSRWYSAAMKRKPLINKWNGTSALTPSFFSTQFCNYLNCHNLRFAKQMYFLCIYFVIWPLPKLS